MLFVQETLCDEKITFSEIVLEDEATGHIRVEGVSDEDRKRVLDRLSDRIALPRATLPKFLR